MFILSKKMINIRAVYIFVKMSHRKTIKRLTISLLLFTGINALIAGSMFIVDPSGSKIGMTTDYLRTSPFTDFLIPGIILLVVNGLFNVFAALAVTRNNPMSPILVILQGLMLSGWIIIQIILVQDFNLLHFVMLLIGIGLIFLGAFQRLTSEDH